MSIDEIFSDYVSEDQEVVSARRLARAVARDIDDYKKANGKSPEGVDQRRVCTTPMKYALMSKYLREAGYAEGVSLISQEAWDQEQANIQRAVKAEREACRQIALKHAEDADAHGATEEYWVSTTIANTIAKRGEP
jgi:hypothetical protein